MINFKQISRVALGALVLGFFGAPSCTALPASETMIVLQTDLSLPKDVDRLTIQVLVRGDQRHFNEFTKLGDEDQLKIPASIGLTLDEGTDLSTPVTFRVTAFQGTNARVLREVVTTIPKDRLVALKLPIQWLCWEDLKLDPSTQQAISNCDAGKTCIAGTCTDKNVDPATLEDYSADRVFGGGTGTGDGSCFDTATCFTGSLDAPVNMADCTIQANADVNVAIRVDSAGICGPSGCFVPLDAKSDLGWKPGASGTIQLPAAVCQRITDKKANGVSIAGASTACPQKTDGIPACGPWSSAGKAPPDPANLGPVTVIANQETPTALALAGGTVYWVNAGIQGNNDGAVRKIALLGGTPTPIQNGQSLPKDLALDVDTNGVATGVIWANFFSGTGGTGTVSRFDFAGGSTVKDVGASILGLSAPVGVAVRGSRLLITDFNGLSVYEVDKATGANVTPLASPAQSSTQQHPNRIVADSKNAFWVNEGDGSPDSGSVVRYDTTSANLTVLGTKQAVPSNLAVDSTTTATWVYWANYADNGEIKRALVAGGSDPAGESFAAGQKKPFGIALDKEFVYWTNKGDGTVWKKSFKDAQATELKVAAGQARPGAITVDVDGTQICWVNEGNGTPNSGSLMRISKTAPAAK